MNGKNRSGARMARIEVAKALSREGRLLEGAFIRKGRLLERGTY